ncbi:methionine--tRNA ligase [Candidatus Gracilibacteria bacterium]|nr:methionine--tRNA ligase [Candidatus Gracilibacteria bacterium]
MPKFYITTSIAYTNAKPHVGFSMELVQADCLARYHRFVGDDVFFMTGTDEHGLKMAQTAREQNMTPQELADKNSAEFRRLSGFLNISIDHFIRTTDDYHVKGCIELWKKLEAAGALYKKSYQGLYCVGCEAYVTEKDLVEGKCPIHQKAPIEFKEENYFFKYSNYLPQVKEKIEKGELIVLPESRKNEILGLIESGIEDGRDVSFSRPTESLSWGIEVPGDPTQTMYVWPDALTNYMTGVGYGTDEAQYKKWWPADVHLIGKDILRFHAGLWIAMLIAAEFPIPKSIYVHGYITSEGQKMSKSLGNVVDPFEIGAQYGVESLRYYLLREIPTTDDGDFSKLRYEVIFDSELANNLGNLVSRVLTMTEKYCGGKVPALVREDAISGRVLETWKNYQQHIAEFNIKMAIEDIIGLLTFSNQYIEEKKPWELAKKDPAAVHIALYNLLEMIRHAALMLKSIIPETADKILDALGAPTDKLYPDAVNWGVLKEGTMTKKIPALFPKIGTPKAE